MFFIHFLEHVLTLHPSFFGSHVKEYLTQKLLDDVEGVCTGDYYIVCVMDTYDISEGRVLPGSGLAEYTIMYRAIVWKPFKGETVDAIVTSVKNQGIFADVGPLTVFVSKHLIPPEIKWDPDAVPPQYTDHADQIIEKGTNLRIKLIGLRNDVRNMFAIGSIKEDYLGFDFEACEEHGTLPVPSRTIPLEGPANASGWNSEYMGAVTLVSRMLAELFPRIEAGLRSTGQEKDVVDTETRA